MDNTIKPCRERAIRHLAQMCIDERADALHLAGEATKSQANWYFKNLTGYDFDIKFSGLELLEAQQLIVGSHQFIENLIYAEAEKNLADDVDAEIERLQNLHQRELEIDRQIDAALDRRAERAA